MARSEEEAATRGWYVAWEYDDCSLRDLWPDHDDFCSQYRRRRFESPSVCRREVYCEHECLFAVAYDEEHNHLASLGGIIDADREYKRDIAAELYSEALSNEEHERGAELLKAYGLTE